MKKVSLFLNKQEDFSSWEVGSEYQIKKIIGQGSYGSVAQAIHKATGKVVAIKRMDDIFADNEDCKKMVREILLLKAMKSHYVTQLLDFIEPQDFNTFRDIYIVMDFIDADLKKVLKSSITLSELHI
jgi:mitogen-activated protein kinase 1/3